MWKRKDEPPRLKHVEIWGHLVEVNRALKRMLMLSAAIALLSVCGLTWAMTTALRKPLIYYVDSNGQASFGGRIGNASQPLEVEVAYVAKEFLKRTVGYNSLTVERDFAEGFNLMTGELQKLEQARFDAWKISKGISFADYIRSAGIRSVFDFKSLKIENHGGKQFSVIVTGVLSTWPIAGGAEAEPKLKSFESHLALVAVKRTEETPNGLLVGHQTINYFEVENVAEDLRDVKGLSGGENAQ